MAQTYFLYINNTFHLFSIYKTCINTAKQISQACYAISDINLERACVNVNVPNMSVESTRGEGEASGMSSGSDKSERKVTLVTPEEYRETFECSYEEFFESEDYLNSDEESFFEITTSEADSLSSSDNDDAEKLEIALQSAYSCSPKKLRLKNEPMLRNSLLLLDKDFIESEGSLVTTFNKLIIIISCKLNIGSSELDSYSDSIDNSSNPSCNESHTDEETSYSQTTVPKCFGSDCESTSEDEDLPRTKRRRRIGEENTSKAKKRKRSGNKVTNQTKGFDTKDTEAKQMDTQQDNTTDAEQTKTQQDTIDKMCVYCIV